MRGFRARTVTKAVTQKEIHIYREDFLWSPKGMHVVQSQHDLDEADAE